MVGGLLLVPGCGADGGAEPIQAGLEARKAAAELAAGMELDMKVRAFQVKHGRNPASLPIFFRQC